MCGGGRVGGQTRQEREHGRHGQKTNRLGGNGAKESASAALCMCFTEMHRNGDKGGGVNSRPVDLVVLRLLI